MLSNHSNTLTEFDVPFSMFIRADADPSMGSGHVMRMLALASACRNIGAHVTFLSSSIPQTLRKKIQQTGAEFLQHEFKPGSIQDAAHTGNLCAQHNFDWTVLDGYQFRDPYQEIVKQQANRLMVVDDFGHDSHRHADLILNQNAYASTDRYAELKSTNILCGLKHTLLRPEFTSDSTDVDSTNTETKCRKNARFTIKRMLITFGGSDSADWTLATLRSLSKLNLANSPKLVADVIIGADYQHEKRLAEFCRTAGMNVFIHRNVDRMDALMRRTDLAITAGGSTCYELAQIGVPAVAIATTENQTAVVEALQDCGTLIGFNETQTTLDSTDSLSPEIEKSITKLVRNREQRQSMSETGRKLLDGMGAQRVARQLHGGVLELRPATLDDFQMLLQLRNDPVVRSGSFNQSSVTLQEHRQWLSQSLTAPNRVLWIACNRHDQQLGKVQIDVSENLQSATISIALDAPFRGQGIGTTLIEKTAAQVLSGSGPLASVEQLVAEIKPTNTASTQAFENAGFEFSEPTTVNNEIALRYVRRADSAVATEVPATIRKSA